MLNRSAEEVLANKNERGSIMRVDLLSDRVCISFIIIVLPNINKLMILADGMICAVKIETVLWCRSIEGFVIFKTFCDSTK